MVWPPPQESTCLQDAHLDHFTTPWLRRLQRYVLVNAQIFAPQAGMGLELPSEHETLCSQNTTRALFVLPGPFVLNQGGEVIPSLAQQEGTARSCKSLSKAAPASATQVITVLADLPSGTRCPARLAATVDKLEVHHQRTVPYVVMGTDAWIVFIRCPASRGNTATRIIR